jgi:spore germination protein
MTAWLRRTSSIHVRAFFWATLLSVGCLQPAKAWDTTFVYQAWWMPQAWRSAPVDGIDRMLFFDLPVEADGSIKQLRGWPHQWQAMLEDFKRGGPAVDLVISILSTERFEAVFRSDEAVNRLLDHGLGLLADQQAKGLHLDFEMYAPIQPEMLVRYRAFVLEFQRRFKAKYPGATLSVFVPMGGVTPLYEAAHLRGFDWIIVQGYDSHWAAGPSAGPVAPLDGNFAINWTKIVRQVAAWGLPRRNVLMSYPLYGYEWPVSSGKPLSATSRAGVTTTLRWVDPLYLPDLRVNVHERVNAFGSKNDEVSGSSYYQFSREGQLHVGWYEGAWSLNRKHQFLQSNLLGGLAFFVLGYDNHSVLREHVLARHQQSAAIQGARRLLLGTR